MIIDKNKNLEYEIRFGTKSRYQRITKIQFDNVIRQMKSVGFSFGIPEYIEIPKVKYDPKIGIIGLNVSVTLERPGFRIKRRKLINRKVSRSHKINKEDAIEFAKNKLGVIVG